MAKSVDPDKSSALSAQVLIIINHRNNNKMNTSDTAEVLPILGCVGAGIAGLLGTGAMVEGSAGLFLVTGGATWAWAAAALAAAALSLG